jgi:phasin family protein
MQNHAIALVDTPVRRGHLLHCSKNRRAAGAAGGLPARNVPIRIRTREVMAAANVTSIEQVEDKMRQGYADMATLQKGNFESVLASSQAMINGYQALSTELLAFVQSRMKEGMEFGKRLASCQSPESAIEANSEFVKGAIKAYTEELRTLGDLGGRMTRETFAPLQERAENVGAKVEENVAA